MDIRCNNLLKFSNYGKKLLRAGFEPATYGYLTMYNYSPPLYQLSYRRCDVRQLIQQWDTSDLLAVSLRSKCHLTFYLFVLIHTGL